jgi:hypothetical protein
MTLQGSQEVLWPYRWQVWGLWFLGALVVAFGVLVEFRSAFLQRRMTDLDVNLRAAWAVRSGGDCYAITDDNQWHYNYPPLLAILLVPLADPPAGVASAWTVPFPVSVALWYMLSFGVLCWSVHQLATALQESTRVAWLRALPPGCQAWWSLRLIPVLACMPVLGATLGHGQVNLLVLACLCGMVAGLIRGRDFRSGLWLAGAICFKVIPLFLLIYPLWRRKLRCLVGCAVGLVLGLGVVPALAFGPARAWGFYQEYSHAVLQPALTHQGDDSRAEELLMIARTSSQSFMATMHNALHINRNTRPNYPSPAVRRVHWMISGALTLLTLSAGGWRPKSGSAEAVFLGMLMVLMVLVSPAGHLHYFCLMLPLVMALVARRWELLGAATVGVGWWLLFTLNFFAHALPHVPRLEVLRDVGLAGYTSLLFWVAGLVVLWRHPDSDAIHPTARPDVVPTAA